MSHIVKGKQKIASLTAMEIAARECNGVLLPNQKTFRAWGSHAPCEAAIAVQGKEDAYTVGLVRLTDGSYEMRYDAFDGVLEKSFGRGLVKLTDHYNLQATLEQQGPEMAALGFTPVVETFENRLVLTYERSDF